MMNCQTKLGANNKRRRGGELVEEGRRGKQNEMQDATHPSFPSSQTYSFISLSPRPAASQLKLGLRL